MVAYEAWGEDTTNTLGTSLSPGNNTKGSYSELIASTGIATKNIWICLHKDGTGDTQDYLVDIATGAVSSEVIVLQDLYLSVKSGRVCIVGPFPLVVAAGTRISARAETTNTTGTESVAVSAIVTDADIPVLTSTSVDTEGAGPGSSGQKGTTIDFGDNGANTKSSYVEVVASAPSNAELMYLVFGRNGNNALTSGTFLVDIAIGAAASEVVEIPDILMATTGATDEMGPLIVGPFPCADMQSSRVAIRGQTTITDATDRVLSFVAYFVRGTVSGGGGGDTFVPKQETTVIVPPFEAVGY